MGAEMKIHATREFHRRNSANKYNLQDLQYRKQKRIEKATEKDVEKVL